MFIAIDKDENRIYADEYKGEECFCPKCEKSVRYKKKSVNNKRAHFAHKSDEMCPFGLDKDYKSEWHIRMQEYFPKEAREYRFKDEETGTPHIADVFIEEKNTVLEFQHSPISEEEFLCRTIFHIKNGRRIAWLFDESRDNKPYGKFGEDDCAWENNIYLNKSFKWLGKPRKVIIKGPNIKEYFDSYSICVFTGTEGDMFHRIVGEHCSFDYVTFSLNNLMMSEDFNVDELFGYDYYWQFEDYVNLQRERYYQQMRMANAISYRPQRRYVKRGRRF